MDFRDLRLVVALADELHFGRAAQRVGIGQPALSQQLRRLERRLDVPLFERSTHRVRLTPAGHAFVLHARPLLTRLEHLDRTTTGHRPEGAPEPDASPEVRDLRVVAALAKELHFGRAAARLHVGQPALSQHLRRLEGRLGVPLFERSTHAVRLTDAGQAFAREARHLLNRLGAFEDHMSSFVEQPTLRVGSIDPIYDLSVTLVAQLGRRLEGVRVTEVAVESFAEAHERMLAGDLDVYLGVRVHTDGVAGFPLRSDRFGAFLATTHPLAGRSSITVADVADEPVMLDPDNRTPEYVAVVRRVFADAGIEPRRSLSGSTSLFGAVLAIPHGGPIVVAPDVDGRPPGVTFVPFSDPTAEDSWHLMWLDPPRRELVTTAVEVVRQVVADEGWQITAGTPR